MTGPSKSDRTGARPRPNVSRLDTPELVLIWFIGLFAFVLMAVVLGFYYSQFAGGLSTKQSDWGIFGDFFGGLVNPVLSFFALIVLLSAVHLQIKELRETRLEMTDSRLAFQESARNARRHSFEITLFDLVRLYNDLVDKLSFQDSRGRSALRSVIGRWDEVGGSVVSAFGTLTVILEFLRRLQDAKDRVEEDGQNQPGPLFSEEEVRGYVGLVDGLVTEEEWEGLFFFSAQRRADPFKDASALGLVKPSVRHGGLDYSWRTKDEGGCLWIVISDEEGQARLRCALERKPDRAPEPGTIDERTRDGWDTRPLELEDHPRVTASAYFVRRVLAWWRPPAS